MACTGGNEREIGAGLNAISEARLDQNIQNTNKKTGIKKCRRNENNFNVEFFNIDGRPRFTKLSIDDGKKIKIAAIDPDFN